MADYIALDKPEAARKLVSRVLELVEQLQLNPKLGARTCTPAASPTRDVLRTGDCCTPRLVVEAAGGPGPYAEDRIECLVRTKTPPSSVRRATCWRSSPRSRTGTASVPAYGQEFDPAFAAVRSQCTMPTAPKPIHTTPKSATPQSSERT